MMGMMELMDREEKLVCFHHYVLHCI